MKDPEGVKAIVRGEYGQAALQARQGRRSCCPNIAPRCLDPMTGNLYGDDQLHALPTAAVAASLGCGNPTPSAELHAGEVVLDLGSGGGIDVLLSARRVGPTGKAYGLDMTDEMLALARENQRAAGVENVEFLKGEIEAIPLPDGQVDVVISNCVINLSPQKERVFQEMFRVLKPKGRLAISDIVIRGRLEPALRHNMELWSGCIAGALEETDYLRQLEQAGFVRIAITPTRLYSRDDAQDFLAGSGVDVQAMSAALDGRIMSAFITARKA